MRLEEKLHLIRNAYLEEFGEDLEMEIILSPKCFDRLVIKYFQTNNYLSRFTPSGISDFKLMGFRVKARNLED